ncbi:hypothetical protein NXC24_PC00822 (plasmid) [Rhizobium sp. NXC24]|nr:hypothetical protein NXC24_PC00822 [Rhizobium sp. NXC24]
MKGDSAAIIPRRKEVRFEQSKVICYGHASETQVAAASLWIVGPAPPTKHSKAVWLHRALLQRSNMWSRSPRYRHKPATLRNRLVKHSAGEKHTACSGIGHAVVPKYLYEAIQFNLFLTLGHRSIVPIAKDESHEHHDLSLLHQRI